jgi:hypothetical protein
MYPTVLNLHDVQACALSPFALGTQRLNWLGRT